MAIDAMAQARQVLIFDRPFWATLAMRLEMIATYHIETAATDMERIFYNPTFMESLRRTVRPFVPAHECGHVMLVHGLRRGNRNPDRWNIACDLALNLALKGDGFEIWEHALIDAKYAGMDAEKIYHVREMERQERQAQNQPDPNAPPGDKWGDKFDAAFGSGHKDLQTPADLDEAKEAEIAANVRDMVAEAAMIASQAGKMSASLERLIQSVLQPRVPWEEELRSIMSRLIRGGEDWCRRNSRVRHLYLPANYRRAIGDVIVIGDTSGSISQSELNKLAGDISGIMDDVRPSSLRVIWWDAKFKRDEVLRVGDPIVLKPLGGGGTRMDLALEYVEDNYGNADAVILVTDGETPWPNTEPNMNLITVCTTKKPVPHGHVIRV